MPMEIDRKQIKQQAREAMSLSKPSFWLVTLVYLLMTTGISSLSNFSEGTLGLFLTIAVTMYCWVVGFSYRLWAIWTVRRLEPGLGSLMEGFSVAGRVIMLECSILTRTMGWAILLSVPAALVLAFSSANLLGYLLVIAALSIAVLVITLRYSLSYYVLADYPDLGPSVALRHSVRLMKGWIGELVKLYLSFAGWYVLSFALSLAGLLLGAFLMGDLGSLAGLSVDAIPRVSAVLNTPVAVLVGNIVCLPLTLFLTPYVEVTLAQFYDARIHLSDNMADPLNRTDLPPL